MEPLENGLLPIGFAESDAAVNDELGGYGGSYFYDADPADNALQYVEQMTVESLGGGTVKMFAHFRPSPYKPSA